MIVRKVKSENLNGSKLLCPESRPAGQPIGVNQNHLNTFLQRVLSKGNENTQLRKENRSSFKDWIVLLAYYGDLFVCANLTIKIVHILNNPQPQDLKSFDHENAFVLKFCYLSH